MSQIIKDFENYSITPQGDVINNISGKKLKGSISVFGYVIVTLYSTVKPKKSKSVRVHRLVAETYLEKPKRGDKDFINHKDGNKRNNTVENLEWTTVVENNQHARETKLQPKNVGTKYTGQYHSKARLFEITYPNGSITEAFGYSELERMLGMSRSYIYKLVSKQKSFKGITIKEVPRDIPQDNTLSKHLITRFTESEDAALREYANSKLLPKSQVIRELVVQLLKKENLLWLKP